MRSWVLGGIGELRDDGATFTIVTTAANEFVAPLHDRMPLILPREARQLWLFGEPEVATKVVVSPTGR